MARKLNLVPNSSAEAAAVNFLRVLIFRGHISSAQKSHSHRKKHTTSSRNPLLINVATDQAK